MLTRSEAARLRGLIGRYRELSIDMFDRGRHEVEDREQIVEDFDEARSALFEFIRSITEKSPKKRSKQ